MSILSDINAALETYRHKVTMLRAELGVHFVPTRIRERDMARERLAELLIEAAPALLDVAWAVDKGKLTAARHSLYPLVKEADDE